MTDVERMRAMLEAARALSQSDNLFASISGERIAVILVDALFELDTSMDDPWNELPAVHAP
jgi:hypothetical protein